MSSPRRFIARIDLSIEIDAPRIAARAARVAEWLQRVARAIERGDIPRHCTASMRVDATAESNPPDARSA
jgi:hypothetical protein